MVEVRLAYPREEARDILLAAFEETREIQSYHDDGDRIVGKTGTTLLGTSYGDRIVAEYERSDTATTHVKLSGSPIITGNFAAKPSKYRDRVHEEVAEILDVEDPLAYARQVGRRHQVPRAADQRGVIVSGKDYPVWRVVLWGLAIVGAVVMWSLVMWSWIVAYA